MNLNERINADFMTAFKAKQMEKKNFLGVIKGDIQTNAGNGIEPTDENVIKIVKKMEKSLLEVDTEESRLELTYLEPYLPKMMSEEDVRNLLKDFIVSTESVNIGSIMKHFNQNYKGLVDNKMLQTLSKEML